MPEPSKDRADRILDAAAALLIRYGYRKVTVEDVARQAGIGKGTVYLHWRTKEKLFEAVILRAYIELCGELLDRIREDPAEVVPHRFLRASYLATMRRPLMLALLTGDSSELIGSLKRDSSYQAQEAVVTDRFATMMAERGLIRSDVPNVQYALQAVGSGFYLVDNLSEEGAGLTLEAKADLLAYTVRSAFEPAEPADPAAVAATAAELVTLLEGLLSIYHKGIYAEPG
ncbi:TetR/AcrR family transcriptional regulator [Amycolatopsis sp. NPDC059657]|uniref:TetR/AcrR family transcriptional regulator n=1 Tax=Amycolatopsis sp. NPDC059657 TaxID=3346899 RepID=UPI00366BDE6D